MSLAPDTFHEFEIPPNLFDDKGVLTIVFANPNNTALLFPLEDGMEVLYRQGGFALRGRDGDQHVAADGGNRGDDHDCQHHGRR